MDLILICGRVIVTVNVNFSYRQSVPPRNRNRKWLSVHLRDTCHRMLAHRSSLFSQEIPAVTCFDSLVSPQALGNQWLTRTECVNLKMVKRCREVTESFESEYARKHATFSVTGLSGDHGLCPQESEFHFFMDKTKWLSQQSSRTFWL